MSSLLRWRFATLSCGLLSALVLSSCEDALVDAPAADAASTQGGSSLVCTVDPSISGPNKVFSYSTFRYTLNWTISSDGFSPECTITATSLGLAPNTPPDVVVCGSGTTNGHPWIDVCTDYAPDGFTFQVKGTVRYFNGVDSGHQYAYASKTVVFDNSLG